MTGTGAAPAGGWTWAALRAERTLVETDEILALDKPPGISVMGERHDEDVVVLAAAAGERLHPVHRIDKVTSGVVLLARTLAAHGPLTRQFAARTATKGYLAVVHGVELPPHWRIDLPLGVGRKSRVRVAAPRERIRYDERAARWSVEAEDVITGKPNYPSVTDVHLLLSGKHASLVLALPRTGRRHQIRVHLAWTGTPIVGDPLFRSTRSAPAERTHLHSWRLHLPGSGLDLTAVPGPDLFTPLDGDLTAALRAATTAWTDHLAEPTRP